MAPSRKRRNGRLGITVVIVVLALAVTAVFAWPKFGRAETTKDLGSGLTVSGKHIPGDLKAKPAPSVHTNLQHVAPLGQMLQVSSASTGHQLKAPLTLHFKLNAKSDGRVVIATSEDGQNWTFPSDVKISSDGRTASVQTTHLSWWQPIQIGWEWIQTFGQQMKDSFTGGFTAEAERPKCKNEPSARDDGYAPSPTFKKGTVDDKGTLWWCLGVEKLNDKTQHVLRVSNPQKYPLDIQYSGFTLIHQPGEISLQQLAKLTEGKGHKILFAGESAIFSVDLAKGKQAQLHTSYSLNSGEAVALNGLESALNALSSVIFKFGKGQTLTKAKTYQEMDHVLQDKDCYNAVAAHDMGKLVVECIKAVDELVGPKAIILGIVSAAGSLAGYFRSGIMGNIDSITSKAEYTLVVKRLDGKPVTFHNLTLYLPQGWHYRYGSDEDSGSYHADQLGIAADCVPQNFWYSPCPAVWIVGSGELDHYADGTETYNSSYPYYPATDIRGCRGEPVLPAPKLWRGKNRLLTSSSRPVGSHIAEYHEWSYECGTLPVTGGGDFTPIAGKSFIQRAWYLPTSKLLIVTEYNISGLGDVLATARWN